MVNFLNKFYLGILKNPFWSVIVVFLTLFISKNAILSEEIYITGIMTAVISLLATLTFNKRFGFKNYLKFFLWFLVFVLIKDFVNIVISLKSAMFASLTVIFYGIYILISLLIRVILKAGIAFAAYSLINLIVHFILNRAMFKKISAKILNFIQKPAFSILLLVFIMVASIFYIGVRNCTREQVVISPFSEIFDYYSTGFGTNKIHNMRDNKIAFLKQGKICIYDLKEHKLVSEFLLSKNINGYRYDNYSILPLQSGNILAKYNKEPSDRTKFYDLAKTVIKIYSPKTNEILLTKEILPIHGFNSAQVELSDGKIAFFGGTYRDLKKSFILDVQNNTIKRVADLNVERDSASAVLLDDGSVFVFGGITDKNFPDNYAEIYNPSKDTFTKIPLGFTVHNYVEKVHLSKMSDGRVLIFCERAYDKKEDGFGSHGFRISDDKFVTIYPAPYLTIFNPKDNSFEEVDVNKGNKYLRSNYDAAVLKDGRIIIASGEYVSKDTHKVREVARDILIYNPEKHTLKKTVKELKHHHGDFNSIFVLEDGRILVTKNIYEIPTPQNQIEVITLK